METPVPPYARSTSLGPQIAAAATFLETVKREYINKVIPNIPSVEVPPENRIEYRNILDQLYRQCAETDQKLPTIYVVFINWNAQQMDHMKRLVKIIVSVHSQRSILTDIARYPRYFIDLDTLKGMVVEHSRILGMYQRRSDFISAQQQQRARVFVQMGQAHQLTTSAAIEGEGAESNSSQQ